MLRTHHTLGGLEAIAQVKLLIAERQPVAVVLAAIAEAKGKK